MAVWPCPFPFRNTFSSRVDHVYVRVMLRNDVLLRSSDVAKPVSDFLGVSEEFVLRSSTSLSFVACPQSMMVYKYWQKPFASNAECSPPLAADVSWNQQLLTKRSPQCTEDVRQRPFLGQTVGQQPSSAGDTRRWEHKGLWRDWEVLLALFSFILLLSILCWLGLMSPAVWRLPSCLAFPQRLLTFIYLISHYRHHSYSFQEGAHPLHASLFFPLSSFSTYLHNFSCV